MTNSHKKAFTLIELLVVIAIISILASILFPVFARARENARRASCLSNLKQIGIGVMMYVQDYDETYPASKNYVTGDSWYNIVQPYIKSEQVFICPNGYTDNIALGNYGANYEILTFLGSSGAPTVITTPPLKMAALQSASQIYMIMDYGHSFVRYSNIYDHSGADWDYLPGMGEGGATCTVTEYSAWGGRINDCQNGRHFGGVNISFADGHAKWIKSAVVVGAARKFASSATRNQSALSPNME